MDPLPHGQEHCILTYQLGWINNPRHPYQRATFQTKRILQQALAEQESIGWEYIFWGYLSSKWIVAQQHEQLAPA